MSVSSHFGNFVFGDKVTKILRDLCLHFVRQDGLLTEKKQKEKNETKVTKIPKNKNMG